MTPAVAMDRLLCAPPCVGTAFYVYRLACGPINNMTPAVASSRLLCAPPCVCTALCVYGLACGPLHVMTPAVAIDRLLCASPCVGTAFSVYCLACGPLNNMRSNGPAVRPGALRGGGPAGRFVAAATELPEPNQPSRTAAEGTAGSFRPFMSM